ncbi:MAG: 5'-nucleotidase C-terminal domain-containing protein [Chloroflexota bacterium]
MLALFGLIIPAGVLAAKPVPPSPVTIQILNVSDWHGNVDPLTGVGGAWNISDRWDEDSLAYPTLRLTAGDDYGATPPVSSFFDDVPAILAERLMGIQVGTLGNHNFDSGIAHLQDQINLAGAPTSTDTPGDPFRYVAANLKNVNANVTGVAPYQMFNVGGVRVAVIGIVNEEAPTLVLPGAFGTIVITDGVTAANKYAEMARGKNKADAVVVITHKGVRNATAPSGELIEFADRLDPTLVDVVIGDHTDVSYSGNRNGILVHENRSYGGTYAKTLLTVQPKAHGAGGRVTTKSVEFVTPTAGALTDNQTSCGDLTYCDQAIVDMLAPYRTQLAILLDGKIGTTTEPFKRGNNIERTREMPIGDLVADGMRWRYGTQLAMVNGGGIRSQMPTCSYSPTDTTLHRSAWDAATLTTIGACAGYAAGGPYDIVLGDAFAALNFSNILNTRTVTGAQLWLAMEHSVRSMPSANGRFAQISGFKFGFRDDITTGCDTATHCNIARIQWMTLSDGTPIPNDSSATYTLALTNFTNLGGDGYFMFNDGVGASQEIDWIVMAEYIKAHPALDPLSWTYDRINHCSGACLAP